MPTVRYYSFAVFVCDTLKQVRENHVYIKTRK